MYDESGEPVATITVIGTELGWADYSEDAAPDDGKEHVPFSVPL